MSLTELLEKLPEPKKYDEFVKGEDVTFATISQYPAVARDISLWVPESMEVDKVAETIKQAAGDLCIKIRLFDTFTKDGRTSYAFRLVFLSYERTLTDVEVNAEMDKVYRAVEEEKWEVR